MLKRLGRGILIIALAICVACSYQVGCYAKTNVIKKFSIALYTNGGTGKTVNKQISYTSANASSKVIDKVTFSKKGYTFYSWNTKADGKGDNISTVKQAAAKVKAGKTLKLYARWGKKIVFKANGGSGKTASQVVPSNQKTRLNENGFTKKGYTFIGWNTKADCGGTSYLDSQYVKNPKNGLTLYAQWKVNKYYVSYNANGGKGSMPVQKFTYGKTAASTKNKFSKTGYIFTGWNTKANGKGTAYANGVTFTKLTSVNNATVTLYAQWKPITFTIGFSPGEGGGYEYDMDVQYGVFKPAEWNGYYYLRDGYVVVSWDVYIWRDNKREDTGKSVAIGEDVSKLCTEDGAYLLFRPNWVEEEYSITYVLNGGENAPGNPTKYCVSDGPLAITNPKREGYTFTGWSPYEGDAPYYKDVILPVPDDDPSGEAESWQLHNYRDLTLYACWSKDD